MLEIKDAVAVITGGGGGIGLAMARYGVDQGGKAVIADIAEDRRARTESHFAGRKDAVEKVVCNVTREEDCSRLADVAVQR